jgi:tRNA pseudouridine38-40 synthase
MKNRERNIKAVLEYNGRNYFGFQRQPGHQTIQGEFEKALSSLLNQEMKIGAASGRTDSGVSAKGQTIHFFVKSSMSLLKMRKGLNALLPQDIAVVRMREVPKTFHARYSVRSKMYEYQIWNHEVRSPLFCDRTLHVAIKLDVVKMKEAARVFLGEHDFKSFCAADPSRSQERNTVRTIKKLKIIKKGSLIRIQITADGFLYKMVRNLVGILIDVGLTRLTVAEVKSILKACDRTQASKTVSAEALMLMSVSY